MLFSLSLSLYTHFHQKQFKKVQVSKKLAPKNSAKMEPLTPAATAKNEPKIC